MYHKLGFIVRSCSEFGTVTMQASCLKSVLKEDGSEPDYLSCMVCTRVQSFNVLRPAYKIGMLKSVPY